MKTYDWIRKLPPTLLQWDEIPLLGAPPEFPWKEYSSFLSSLFKLSSFNITPSEIEWRETEDYFHGIANPVTVPLQIDGIPGALLFAMPQGDLLTLFDLLLQNKEDNLELEEDFKESFTQFLALEAIHAIRNVKFDPSLSIQVTSNKELPMEAALCQDITIQLEDRKITGRIILSSEFRSSWASRYSIKSKEAYLNSPIAEKLNLTLHVETGKVVIGQKEWSTISNGDFLLLDQCNLNPTTNEGTAALTVNGFTLFNATIKEGNIQISESPHIQRDEEVQKVVEEHPPHEEEEKFDEDFDEETEFDEDTEFDFDEETFEFEEEEEEAEETPPTPEVEEVVEEAEEKPEEPTPATPTQSVKEIFSPEDIPLNISVEVGNFQMSIKELSELAPGNLLELGVHPEHGVDLLYNGKCIARGELLQVGENLGVRIIEKG